MTFRIQIASPPDREELVAELWVGSEQIAELRKQAGTVRVQLYACSGAPWWDVDYEELSSAFRRAHEYLLK